MDTPSQSSRNPNYSSRRANEKSKSFLGKGLGIKGNDKVYQLNMPQNPEATGVMSQEMTARFDEGQEVTRNGVKALKSDKKNQGSIKKQQRNMNRDRMKVNMLEDKIFQQENMLNDWLQNSKVIRKIKNGQKQEMPPVLNADALNYQDKVITKKDLVKGRQMVSQRKSSSSNPMNGKSAKRRNFEQPKKSTRSSNKYSNIENEI